MVSIVVATVAWAVASAWAVVYAVGVTKWGWRRTSRKALVVFTVTVTATGLAALNIAVRDVALVMLVTPFVLLMVFAGMTIAFKVARLTDPDSVT